MVLTVEEKLNRLQGMDDWEIYRPEIKEFLIGIANGQDPEVAFSKIHHAKNPRWRASLWLRRKDVQRALDLIKYVRKTRVYSQSELLEDLTYRIRKQNLDDEVFLKLAALIAKVSGWDRPKQAAPTEEEKEESLNEKVIEAERKRRDGEEG